MGTKLDRYLALIEEAGAKSFGVVFPDLPGCTSHGTSFDEAVANAAEALAMHLEGLREDGETIPAPRTLSAIRADAQDWFDLSQPGIFITALPPKSTVERVNISLEKDLLRAIDGAAGKSGLNRSAWLSHAAKVLLQA